MVPPGDTPSSADAGVPKGFCCGCRRGCSGEKLLSDGFKGQARSEKSGSCEVARERQVRLGAGPASTSALLVPAHLPLPVQELSPALCFTADARPSFLR